MAVNKVILIGNLGRDPEVRTFDNGSKVANLTVATSERWKDRNTGEQRERTEWHRIAVFVDGAVNYCQNYLRKGSKVYVEGKLETRKWQDQSGQDRFSTEVVIRPYNGSVQGLDRPQGQGDNNGSNQGSYGQGASSGAGQGGEGIGPRTRGADGNGHFDDEIPF